MLIKSRKGRRPLLVGFIILFVVSLLSFNKQKILIEAFNTLEYINAQDFGYSSLKGLVGVSAIHILGENPTALAERVITHVVPRLPEILWSKLQGFPHRPALERVDVDVRFEDYQKILQDRERALTSGMLEKAQEVRAKVRYKDRYMKAKIRLKGDLPDHWRAKSRMSFRVSLKGKGILKGFSRFSLHSPGSRQYPYDPIFQDFARSGGVLSARHDYVRLYVNGTDWGVMNVEEHMSKELLEKQQAKDSLIFKFGNEINWRSRVTGVDLYGVNRLSDHGLMVHVYQAKKYLANPLYRQYFSYISAQKLAGRDLEIADVDTITRAALMCGLWNNLHTLGPNNTRFYLSPYNLALEPIMTDQGFFVPYKDNQNPLSELGGIFREVLQSEVGKQSFAQNLSEVSQAAEQLEPLIDKYTRYFPSDYPIDFGPLNKNILRLTELNEPLKPIIEKQEEHVFKDITQAQVQAMPYFVHVRHFDNGKLVLYNLLPFPVKVEGIYFKGKRLELSTGTVPSAYKGEGLLEFDTDITGLHDESFRVETSLKGVQKQAMSGYSHIANTFNPLTQTPLDLSLPFLAQIGEGQYRIKAGDWEIKYPFVIPGGLEIEAGAHLRFASIAYMIVKGELQALGRSDNKIVLEAADGVSWKGFYVMQGRKGSRLKHMEVRRTTRLQDGMLDLTGGVTFYRSPVVLEDVLLDTTLAEDALNLVKSPFTMTRVELRNTPSDGLDSDFSDGKIISSSFFEIGGDAVDFSGSVVSIEEMKAHNVHDKAVSAGEGSTISVRNSHFKQVGVGIASKDGSVVKAEEIEVEDYKLYGVMTYVKKLMFGSSSLHISSSRFDTGQISSRQEGTELVIDGQSVDSQEVNVRELYAGEVMKK